MTLSDEYKRQFAWRSWSSILNLLPPLDGQVVLDMGCGVGDVAMVLTNRGARVIGVDANEELLATARSRGIPNAEFRSDDLRTLLNVDEVVDGIWCSFAAAYFPAIRPVLDCWRNHLKSGGWIALTEIDDFFGHEPVEPQTRSLLAAYTREALAANRYDFNMGSKLHRYLEGSGFTVSKELTIPDKELSFEGPADSDVVDAWRSRLDRMKLLKDICGPSFEHVRDDFLGALMHPNHRCTTKVYCCIGTDSPTPRP